MNLELPKREQPDHQSIDTSPEALREWVEGLPLLNTEATRQLLVDVLERINALDLPPHNRNESLEILSTSLMCVTDALKKEVLGKSLPLQPRYARCAEQALELCNLMATGYRIMADDLGQDELQNDQLSVAIHRSLRYLSEIMLGHYQIYRNYPESLWRCIHALYALAEECGTSRTSINDITLPTPDSSSIETIYKQILLLSLACPYRLQQKEIHFTYNALIDWASFCQLVIPGSDKGRGLFCVNLQSDDPPSYRGLHSDKENDSNHIRILDTTAVTDRLRALLDNAKRTQTGFGNKDTLQQLILSWGAMPKRRFPRHASASSIPVKLVVGLNTIHQLVSEPGDSDENNDDTITDDAWLQDPTFDRTVNIELDPYFTGDRTDSAPDKAGNGNTLRGAYSAADRNDGNVEFWKIADMSAAGYCLLWENSDASTISIGELVAIVDQEATETSDEKPWQLGVTRWMKFDPEHGLELGIQMLAPGALSVWAYVRKDEVGKNIAAIDRMQGILLPGIDAIGQRDSLILPCLPFRTGCNSILEISGETSSVVLTRQLENTGRFAQYHYDEQDEQYI